MTEEFLVEFYDVEFELLEDEEEEEEEDELPSTFPNGFPKIPEGLEYFETPFDWSNPNAVFLLIFFFIFVILIKIIK